MIESLYLKRGTVLDEFLQLLWVFDEQVRCRLGNGQSGLVFPREPADWLLICTFGRSTARPAERTRKASVVQFQQPVEFRLAWIESFRPIEIEKRLGTSAQGRTDFIPEGIHSPHVTAHALTSIAHDRVFRIGPVSNDIHGCGVNPFPLPVRDEVRLQTIRQIENDFPAVRPKIQRIPENVLPGIVAGEVETFPIGAINCGMPLHGTVVARNT